MRYVAAYLLAVLGGNESPTSKDLKKILDSVGIETDDERMNKVISELNGKNIEDVIAQGNGKLASMPAGGAVAVSAGGGSAAPAATAAPAAGECEPRGVATGQLLLFLLRRRKKRRRRNQKNLMMIWDLASLINYLL
ncbi:60S acidic ribosomal protein P2 isoform X1 [Parus major]|uniref:60S acidic ribosomal protein P2 isoform X1 n=1 Tax=Parus major TaxID=9157 RepID=UPI00144480A9|nr:60S acidic ribosomal protein P2 isoform X1 [Parus major]XP_033371072.1 60S acidic ribosomal protein P2 isoform X1 [Parus major]